MQIICGRYIYNKIRKAKQENFENHQLYLEGLRALPFYLTSSLLVPLWWTTHQGSEKSKCSIAAPSDNFPGLEHSYHHRQEPHKLNSFIWARERALEQLIPSGANYIVQRGTLRSTINFLPVSLNRTVEKLCSKRKAQEGVQLKLSSDRVEWSY